MLHGLLQKTDYCVVIGGANIDIGGKSFVPLTPADSHPGKVSISYGGVGRNIAENLAKMGATVHLLTFLGQDTYGLEIHTACTKCGINLSSTLMAPQASTPIYLYINNEKGDMALAINDSEIEKYITVEYIEKHLPLINSAKIVVADTNLSKDVLVYLADRCTAPLFVDPVSTTKAMKIKDILHKINILKQNKLEAEKLTGVRINSNDDLPKVAQILIDQGLRKLFISLGSEGVFFADKNGMMQLPCQPIKVQNTKGAGDAFATGLIIAALLHYNTQQMAEYAIKISEQYLMGKL